MLAVEDLHACYGRAHILQGISLEAAAGEVVALLGRNGAGKSTTIKSIMGLVPPAAGTVSFAGQRVERLPPYRIARLGLGYVPEERRIFTELSVMENLEVGRQPPRAGGTRPMIALIAVDLPAPLRPSSATTSPSPTSSAISNRICAGP